MTKEEVLKEFRVRELLEATRRVIGQHGFQGATIDRVAEEAKVAKGTVYLYFTNKDDLLSAAVLQGLESMVLELRQSTAGLSAPGERLKAMVRQQFKTLNSNQDFVKALMLERSLASPNPEDSRSMGILRVFTDYLETVAGILKSAMDQGVARKIDPQLAAFMLNELISGSLRRRLLQLVTTPPEADAEAVLDLFLNGILSK